MTSLFSSKREVFVCNADNLLGFYAAMGIQQSKQFQRVICGVTDRDDEFSKQLERQGCEVKEWNLRERRSIEDSITGVNHVLLVPQPTENILDTTRNILEVCKSIEIRNLGLWSSLGVEEAHGEKFKNFKILREVEEMVERAGIENLWIARIGEGIQKLFALSHIIQDRGVLPLPVGRGKWAPVNLLDCGHASAHLLQRSGTSIESRHRRIYTFTGTEMVTGRKLVEHANRVLQAEIEFQEISEEDFRKLLKESKEMENFEIELLMEIMRLIKENMFAKRTDDLEKMLEGKQPTDIETFFKRNADAFRPGGGRIRRFASSEIREDRKI